MTIRMRVTLLYGDRDLYSQMYLIKSVRRAPETFLLTTVFFSIFQSLIKDNDGKQNLAGNHIEVLKLCCQNGLTVVTK